MTYFEGGISMIYFDTVETRTSIACLERLDDNWLQKVAMLDKSDATEATLLSTKKNEIRIVKSSEVPNTDETLYYFILKDKAKNTVNTSAVFELYSFDDEYDFSFCNESVKTSVEAYFKTKDVPSFEADAKKLTVGSSLCVSAEYFDDTVLYVRKIHENEYIFVKKIYSIVTFTYKSEVFKFA